MGCRPGIVTFGKALKDRLSQGLVAHTWWTHGGCWVLARALHEYLGDDRTELWGVGDPLTGIAYHLVVKVAADCFLDADGASTDEQMLKRWKKIFPGRYLILRKLSDGEKNALVCDEGPSVEEMVDRLTLGFVPVEILWRSFFS